MSVLPPVIGYLLNFISQCYRTQIIKSYFNNEFQEKLDDNNVRQKVSVDTNDSVERNTVIGYPRNYVTVGIITIAFGDFLTLNP